MLAVAPTHITVNPTPTRAVILIIGVLDGIAMEGRKFRFDGIQPRRFRWQINRLHIVPWKEFFGCTDIGREIVHHNIDAELKRITVSEAPKTHYNVFGGFALPHLSDQAITVYIIESMQLFYTAFARIGCTMALRTLMACPAPACHRS